jgi:hypothetical protein
MVFDNRAMAENEQDVVDRHNSQAKNKDWVRKIETKEYWANCNPVVIEGGINKKGRRQWKKREMHNKEGHRRSTDTEQYRDRQT